MIRIKKEHYLKILQHTLANLPEEACGLLGGTVQDGEKIIEEVYLLTNVDHSSEHFSMDPKEQFAVHKELRRLKHVMIGNFHSHPETPARPSQEDIRLAFNPGISYFILSLQDQEKPVLKSFKIEGKNVIEEELVII